MEWTNEMVLNFLDVLETEPVIWNTRHPMNKNRTEVEQAWEKIAKEMNFEFSIQELKKKRVSLMASFRHLVMKAKASKETAITPDEVYKPSWFAYEKMAKFLKYLYEPTRAEKNAEDVCDKEGNGSAIDEDDTTESADKESTRTDDVTAQNLGEKSRSKKTSQVEGRRHKNSSSKQLPKEMHESVNLNPKVAFPNIFAPRSEITELEAMVQKLSEDNRTEAIQSQGGNTLPNEAETAFQCHTHLEHPKDNKGHRRKRLSPMSETETRTGVATSALKHVPVKTPEDECNLYCDLLEKKLKTLHEKIRIVVMNDIDNVVFRAQMYQLSHAQQAANSAFYSFANHPFSAMFPSAHPSPLNFNQAQAPCFSTSGRKVPHSNLLQPASSSASSRQKSNTNLQTADSCLNSSVPDYSSSPK